MFKKTVAFTIILCTLLSALAGCNDNIENDLSDIDTTIEQTTALETVETTNVSTEEITSVETEVTTSIETEESTSAETVETTSAETEEITSLETEEITSVETEVTTSVETEVTTSIETEVTTSLETEVTTNSNIEESTTPELIDSMPIDYKHALQNKHNFALGGQGIKEPTNIFIGQYKHPNSDKYLYEYDTVEYSIVDTYTLLIKDGDGNILMIENFGALVSTDIYDKDLNTNSYEWHKVSIEKYVIHEDTKKYSQKYPNVEIEYEKILDAYFEFARSYRYGKYDSDLLEEKYSDISNESLYAIESALASHKAFYLSYAQKDLNGDGISELFIIDNSFNIYGIMTIINGNPTVIDYIANPNYNAPSYVDTNGAIYTEKSNKGECWQKNVLTLNKDGKLCGYSYGHYDMTGFGDDDVYNYYCEYDAKHPYNSESSALYKRISDEELEELEAQLKATVIEMNLDGSENTEDVTRDAGITVYQVITYSDAK